MMNSLLQDISFAAHQSIQKQLQKETNLNIDDIFDKGRSFLNTNKYLKALDDMFLEQNIKIYYSEVNAGLHNYATTVRLMNFSHDAIYTLFTNTNLQIQITISESRGYWVYGSIEFQANGYKSKNYIMDVTSTPGKVLFKYTEYCHDKLENILKNDFKGKIYPYLNPKIICDYMYHHCDETEIFNILTKKTSNLIWIPVNEPLLNINPVKETI